MCRDEDDGNPATFSVQLSLQFQTGHSGHADIRMPGMSGLELQAQLNAERCRIPIIFITAHGDAKMRMQALRAGAVEFLAKPFDDEALLESVRAALEI